jgi:hypothetical protein
LARSGVLRAAAAPRAPVEPGRQPDPTAHGISLPPAHSAPDTFWNDGLVGLLGWVEDHGAALPGLADRWKDQPVGRWVRAQRQRKDRLNDAQIAALEALPGWCWDEEAARWEQGFRGLSRWAAEYGHANPPRGTAGVGLARLAQWAAQQRALHRQGRLSPDRIARLEALPAWRWER